MREMKDSGIEWIGEIPKEWKKQRLRFLCKINTGNMDTQDNDPEGEYPFFVRSPIVEHSKRYTFDNEAVLMAGDGVGAGKVFHYVMGKYGCHQRVYSMSDFSDVEGKYLYYYLLENFYKKIEESNAKSTVDSVRLPMLKDFYVVFPNKAIQHRIVNYLDEKCAKIDTLIEKQQEIIEKLKEYKLSVITEAVTKGLNPNVEMKDSGCKWIGHIPKHWEMIYPKKLFSQRKDKAYEEDEQLTSSQKYGIISQKDFMELEGRQVMQVIKGEEILKHVEQGDFVISMRSFQGGLEYSEISGKISSAYVMVVPNNGLVYDRYYKWLFKSSHYITALQGTTNLIRDGQALRFSNFIQVYLPVFGKDEQKKIADYLDEICPTIETEIEKREKLLDKINEYKKSLIYEVVTGKKEV